MIKRLTPAELRRSFSCHFFPARPLIKTRNDSVISLSDQSVIWPISNSAPKSLVQFSVNLLGKYQMQKSRKASATSC